MWPFPKPAPSEPTPLSLDQALDELARLGVALLPGVKRSDLLISLSSGKGESVDRVELLCALGGEAEAGDYGWLSNDIWHVDAECIVEDGDYVRLAKRFIDLAKGTLPLATLHDHVDIENGEAWFEFQLNERTIRWDLTINDDWMDPTFYVNFQLLLSSQSKLGFMICALGQDSLILCGDDKLRSAISKFSGHSFQRE